MNQYKPLEETIINMVENYNFYANLVLCMDKKLDKSVVMAAVSITDRVNLHINPDDFNGLSLPERVGILIHECRHILDNHIGRGKAIEGKFSHDLNIAADRAINGHLNLNDGRKLVASIPDQLSIPVRGKPFKPITEKNFNEMYQVTANNNETMEYYYRIIKQNKKDGQGQCEDDGQVLDDHSKWAEGEQNSEIVKEIIRNTANKAAQRTQGTIPGDIQLKINELNKSIVNWKHVLSRFTAKCIQTKVDSSRKRRSRRYGIIHPGLIKTPVLKLGIAYDSSGSVHDEYLKQFFSEIKKIHALGIEIYLVEADCKVQSAYTYDPKKPITVKGRGGTAFQPAIDELLKIQCDAIVYFTDGECDELINCKKPLLWALCPSFTIPKGGEKNHVKITVDERT